MGLPELLLILAVVLLIVGATRLPRLARSIGRTPEEFKKGQADSPADGDTAHPV